MFGCVVAVFRSSVSASPLRPRVVVYCWSVFLMWQRTTHSSCEVVVFPVSLCGVVELYGEVHVIADAVLC